MAEAWQDMPQPKEETPPERYQPPTDDEIPF
jgi:hypothetical protein